MLKKIGTVVLVCMVLSISLQAGSVYKRNALRVMNRFIYVMQHNSFKTSARKVVPLMHKSLLNARGTRLDDDTYRYSFKKAYQNAKNYAYPVHVTRAQRLRTTGVGYGATYQRGFEYKLWIAKKRGVAGMPAPLVLFFPEGSTVPKLTYVGSL